MTGICIVEATCGYSDTFSETSAGSLRFGTVTIPYSATNNITVPNELDNGNLTLSYTGYAGLLAIFTVLDYDNGDDFTNYELIDSPGDRTVIINYRVGQHWMRCAKSTCVEGLNRTYEFSS
jgi:hypothetical protein